MIHQHVSIVMCTYNGEKYLHEQLDSIINQSYPIYELIIQDDCSTDRTIEIIQEYMQEHPFIKLFINENQRGYNQNFLSAILKASGDAIAIADQDDIWDPYKIEKQLNKLNEGHSFVCHNPYLFEDSPTKVISKRHNEAPVISELRLVTKPFIPGHECLFTKEALPFIQKLYNKERNLAYAYIIAIVCITLGEIAYLNEGLVYWRRHSNAATQRNKNPESGAVGGSIQSFAALFSPTQKAIPKRYFKAISILSFQTKETRKIVHKMQGNIFQILSACAICFKQTSSLFKKVSLRNRIKAAFTPLHLIREGRFLIK